MISMRHIVLRAVLLLACTAICGRAEADSRLLPGHALVLSDTLESVVLTTDAGLTGNVRIENDGDLSCLSVVSGGAVVVGTSGCSDSDGPLRIAVPPDMPVTLNASGDGTVHLGDLQGPVVATITGTVDIRGGRVGNLVLNQRSGGDVVLGDVASSAMLTITGSGDVKLRSLHGSLNVRQHGSGDLAIGRIDADSADLQGTGSGDMLLGAGSITYLRAQFAGAGDLAIAATVRDGDVAAAGGSDIKLGTVTGHLNRSASGGSDIIVGGASVLDAVVGKLARVVADSSGSGSTVVSHHGGIAFHHVLTALFVSVVLYIVWRMVQRAGGPGQVRRRMGAAQPEAPTHPGVMALGEMMTRLEQRLGMVEGYVTTREFDLNRKFRELGSN